MGNNSSIKQLQQVMLEMAGISGEAWVAETSMGNRDRCCRRTRVLSFLPPHISSTAVLEVPKQIAPYMLSFLLLMSSFPQEGTKFPPVSVVH